MTEPAPPPTDGHPELRSRVSRRLADDQASEGFPAERLAAIDAAVRRRTVRTPVTNLAGHLRALDLAADIDVDPPVASAKAAGRGVKVAVSRLVGWYVGHVAGQVRELGTATARAIRATASRVDDLERRIDELDERTSGPGAGP